MDPQSKRTPNQNQSQFPRTQDLPLQSSKYWAKEKDRFIRQLLLSDLRQLTGRETIVYFAQLTHGITHSDADDLSEVIEGLEGKDVDLVIQTPGGQVDAVEKIVTMLNQRLDSYRVIVPSLAKSGGTAIAISSSEILLGINSELGPIDPQFEVHGLGMVPCEYIAADNSKDVLLRSMAGAAVSRMKSLAKKILVNGMLSESTDPQVDEVIKKLSSSDSYNSHGAVIDYSEAKSVGLNATWLEPSDPIWKTVWLLYCCYDQDAQTKGLGKIIEGEKFSLARKI